jgi:uncharacterized protein involved in cysteine biosynthesis
MFIEGIKDIKNGMPELRKFGVTVGIALCLAAGLLWWRGKDYYLYFLVISLIFLLVSLITPILLKPIHKIWMILAILLGWLTTRVILIILYYLIITPIGILARLFGKDFLDLKFKKNAADSYWISRGAFKFDKKNYERPF